MPTSPLESTYPKEVSAGLVSAVKPRPATTGQGLFLSAADADAFISTFSWKRIETFQLLLPHTTQLAVLFPGLLA